MECDCGYRLLAEQVCTECGRDYAQASLIIDMWPYVAISLAAQAMLLAGLAVDYAGAIVRRLETLRGLAIWVEAVGLTLSLVGALWCYRQLEKGRSRRHMKRMIRTNLFVGWAAPCCCCFC